MAYSKDAQKRYKEKIKKFAVQFNLSEIHAINAFQELLSNENQSANTYLKGMIYRELLRKGYLLESDIPKKYTTEE